MSTTTLEFMKRYEPEDDGLRFSELTYPGHHPDLPPIPDGILGDKMVRARAKTKALEKLTKEDVLKEKFTKDEMNDLIMYFGWNMWDVLALRATEGASGLIPRQEYECLAYMNMFFRYPELMNYIMDRVGVEGLFGIGASAKREIGTKVNPLHHWCIVATPLGGRAALLAGEWIKPGDYTEEINTMLKFVQRVSWAHRQDGYFLASQDRYRNQIHDPELVQRIFEETEELDHEKYDLVTAFNATAELLAFLDHFDCRLGLGDAGPYLVEPGKIMIIRDLFVNEDVYHWSDVCEGLPYCFTLGLVINAEKMGLEEIRINDISTTFTRPANYVAYIERAVIYKRETWDTPMSDVKRVPREELPQWMEKISDAIIKLYKKLSKMSRRQLITNGLYVYYVGKILPYLRAAGVYEDVCNELDLWEIDKRVSELYYEITKRNFVYEVMPRAVFSGEGFALIPENARMGASKYTWI